MLLHTCHLSEQSKNTPKLTLDYLREQYKYSKKRLLCFDYDVRSLRQFNNDNPFIDLYYMYRAH